MRSRAVLPLLAVVAGLAWTTFPVSSHRFSSINSLTHSGAGRARLLLVAGPVGGGGNGGTGTAGDTNQNFPEAKSDGEMMGTPPSMDAPPLEPDGNGDNGNSNNNSNNDTNNVPPPATGTSGSTR